MKNCISREGHAEVRRDLREHGIGYRTASNGAKILRILMEGADNSHVINLERQPRHQVVCSMQTYGEHPDWTRSRRDSAPAPRGDGVRLDVEEGLIMLRTAHLLSALPAGDLAIRQAESLIYQTEALVG